MGSRLRGNDDEIKGIFMAKTPTGLTAADLFERNRNWAAAMVEQDPGFFKDLASQQAPEYLCDVAANCSFTATSLTSSCTRT
jgi:hypothetical protein